MCCRHFVFFVHPSQASIVLKKLNTGSHKQRHMMALDSSFLMPKISAKFDQGHLVRGRQIFLPFGCEWVDVSSGLAHSFGVKVTPFPFVTFRHKSRSPLPE